MPEDAAPEQPPTAPEPVPLRTVAREWGRIGCIGFGGPPAHIALLRQLCVEDRGWLSASEFEDGVAACNLLPGPASTQLAIFCAWRLRGAAGALIGGLCFIVPGLIIILGLSVVFLAQHPPGWIRGAADGAGAAVPAVAIAAAIGLAPASWRRLVGAGTASREVQGGRPPEPKLRWRGGARRMRVLAESAFGAERRAGAGGSGGSPPGKQSGGSSPRDEMSGGPGGSSPRKARWAGYALGGGVAAATVGPWLVLVLAACGLAEVAVTTARDRASRPGPSALLLPLAAVPATGGLLAVAWVAVKVGLLSYGGGFVIIPLMQHDAVHTYHWMTAAQFLDAVALGQVTPGPVVQTVAVVGYAAHGVGGGLLASAVAFTPSFLFVLGGGRYFDRLRRNAAVQAFLTGAGPAAIGAIAGAAIPLARALGHEWQFGLLALAALWLIGLRRGVVTGIVGAAGLGVLAFLAGAPVG